MRDFSDLTIIIPTLNEVKNIPKLVKLLTGRYKGVRIIISDDGSEDGTKEAVLRIARGNNRISFLDRGRRRIHGLTESVIDAAMRANTKHIVVMDGDMQHPFQKVGALAKGLEKFDIVIGVRSRVKDWGIHRRVISKSVSSFAYAVFKLRNKKVTKDMMSGFFGVRTQLFKSLIRNSRKQFVGRGYKVLLDMLRISDNTIKVGEVDYVTFHDRKAGKSKLNAKALVTHQAVNFFKSTLK